MNWANVLIQDRKFGEAADILRKGTAIRPNSLSLQLSLARCLSEIGNAAGAREVLIKVEEIDPEAALRYAYLGGGTTTRRAGIGDDDVIFWEEGE